MRDPRISILNIGVSFPEDIDKNIETFDVFINNDGDLSEKQGSMVITGTRDQIMTLINNEDYKTILTKAAHVVPNLSIQTADTGNAVMQRHRQRVVRRDGGERFRQAVLQSCDQLK